MGTSPHVHMPIMCHQVRLPIFSCCSERKIFQAHPGGRLFPPYTGASTKFRQPQVCLIVVTFMWICDKQWSQKSLLIQSDERTYLPEKVAVLTAIIFRGLILFANECVENITKTAYLLGYTTVYRLESKTLATLQLLYIQFHPGSFGQKLIWRCKLLYPKGRQSCLNHFSKADNRD